MFTKHLEGWDLGQIIDGLKRGGVQGADLCVRPGYPVNPENAKTELPAAAKRFADEGLCIPLITTPGDLTDTSPEYTESLWDACAEAGVGLVKLGYWQMEEDGYWATIDRCRKKLDGFAKLAEKTGVKAVVHNHSGSTMGLNSCSVMNIVKGFDPKLVGVFTDVGHLSIVGEPYPMALDIVKEYISCIAFKDLYRKQKPDGSWAIDMAPLGQAFGNFPQVMKLLKDMELEIPISFHCEYHYMPPESVIDQLRIDVRFIKAIVDELE